MEEPEMPRAKRPASAPASVELPVVSKLNQPYPADGPRTKGDKEHDFALVADIVSRCTQCKELALTRRQTVFGVGNVNARVAFFGEAPGADEDRQGEPFVGRAGQLLTKIIEACGWRREDVYILNVLKCRPPDNRTPLPPEVDNCRQYFERQFEVIRPEYIVCVGAVPAQALLETTEAVGKLRGRFHRYRDSKVLVTYHPSYLLRNPAAKKFVWEDMQMLLREMGLPIPGSKQ
jgi:uracil-DNA glycosylase